MPVDVIYAVMEGATKLIHGVLPYGHLPPGVIHGDTYPILSYALYTPLALVAPVSSLWDSVDGGLAVAVLAALVGRLGRASGRRRPSSGATPVRAGPAQARGGRAPRGAGLARVSLGADHRLDRHDRHRAGGDAGHRRAAVAPPDRVQRSARRSPAGSSSRRLRSLPVSLAPLRGRRLVGARRDRLVSLRWLARDPARARRRARPGSDGPRRRVPVLRAARSSRCGARSGSTASSRSDRGASSAWSPGRGEAPPRARAGAGPNAGWRRSPPRS